MKRSTRRFLGAMGSILDISPSTDYVTIAGGNLSDKENFRRDCEAITADFRKVIEAYNVESKGYGSNIGTQRPLARAR
ncbi:MULTISPECIES: hypothetical protein [Brenneria]|uniref:hypothetical protein n=1 Tax=Brenneria TaxID=71655 RepID=UPI00022F78A3|nr:MULTISPECIES: hypothetical protein [Brenneria]EHD21290.1 hypothetical protein BrE312_1899 [Brenneria sp. EniD312]